MTKLGAFLLAFVPCVALAAPAPKVAIADTKHLATPLPTPYDEKADASAAVDDAFTRAKTSGKRVMIEMGANWCSDCRILAGVMALPEVSKFVGDNFETVHVDVGRFDHNQQIPARFHAKVNGIPWIVIAEPDGKVLASSYEITDGYHKTPQSMVDWLAKWAK
ncbi:MAG: thioredoxin family protein [Alphaproteobacteria bacterium]